MTSLPSALHNPAMISGNVPGSESDLRAQVETLRVQLADANERAEVAERKLAFCKQELAVAREALESSRRALMLKQSEVDDLTAQAMLWRIVPPAVKTWWGACGFMPPFHRDGTYEPPHDCVMDKSGMLVAVFQNESVADVIAALLNEAAKRMGHK